jgi:hypothetical protein
MGPSVTRLGTFDSAWAASARTRWIGRKSRTADVERCVGCSSYEMRPGAPSEEEDLLMKALSEQLTELATAD